MGVRVDNQSLNLPNRVGLDEVPKKVNKPEEPSKAKATAERTPTNDEIRDILKQDPKDVEKAVREAVERHNENVRFINPTVRFAIDDDTKQIVAKVVDSSNDKEEKVIRQIPAEELLRLAKKIDEIKGLVFDKKE